MNRWYGEKKYGVSIARLPDDGLPAAANAEGECFRIALANNGSPTITTNKHATKT
jgi:hypothetical protein